MGEDDRIGSEWNITLNYQKFFILNEESQFYSMARRRRRYYRQYNRPTGPIAEFGEGVGLGAGVVLIELLIFAYSEFYNSLFKVNQILSPPLSSLSSYFSFTMLLLSGCGILHYFLLGLIDSEAVSVGFLFGDFVTLVLLGRILWYLSPSIVIGMVCALLIVICGFFLRLFMKSSNPPQYDEWY